MSMIMIRCPETGSEISTGIECEDADFRSLPFVITQTTCPSCGREHSWSKSDAWLNDGTSDSKGGQMDGSSVSKRSPDERSDIRVPPASMDRPRHQVDRLWECESTARRCPSVRHWVGPFRPAIPDFASLIRATCYGASGSCPPLVRCTQATARREPG
jgi:hypothetical protein